MSFLKIQLAFITMILGIFACSEAMAQAELVATAEVRFDQIDNESDRSDAIIEFGANVGLAKTFVRVLTFSGHVGVVGAVKHQTPFTYAYHLTTTSASSLFGISLLAQLVVHTPNELFGLTGGVSARTFFAPTRSGLFRVDAFVGPALKIRTKQTLDAFSIGMRGHFLLIDDFETVFDVRTRKIAWSIFASWSF